MKKSAVLMFILVAFVVFLGPAHAAQLNQKNTGCGLGTMVFEGQDGLASQTFAATTNGTFGNQTFGMTSGTSNCEKPASFSSNKKLNEFVSANMDNLAMDIARGNGEYLNTLAILAEVPESKHVVFYRQLQSNFSSIYTSDKVTHIDVLNNIEALSTYM
jgi:hypothetical protein